MALNSREAEIFRRLIQQNNELQIRVERLEKFAYSSWTLLPKSIKKWMLSHLFVPPTPSIKPQLMKWAHIDSIPDATLTVAWSIDKHGEMPKEIEGFDEAEGY